MPLISLLIASSLAAFGYRQYDQHAARARGLQVAMPTDASVDAAQATTVNFRCDGRTYCSQMTSCARKLPRQVDSFKVEFPLRAVARGIAPAAGFPARHVV